MEEEFNEIIENLNKETLSSFNDSKCKKLYVFLHNILEANKKQVAVDFIIKN